MKYFFDEFVLDCANNQLIGPQGNVQFRPQLIKILRVLLSNPGEIVTTDTLLERVWGQVVVSPSTVAQCIREIRKALRDDAQNPRFIQTVHRVGYRWICDIKPAYKTNKAIKIGIAAILMITAAISIYSINDIKKQTPTTSTDAKSEQLLNNQLASIESLKNVLQRHEKLNQLLIQFPDSSRVKLAQAKLYAHEYQLLQLKTSLQPLNQIHLPRTQSIELALLNAQAAGLQSQYEQQGELATAALLDYVDIPPQLKLELEIAQLNSQLRQDRALNAPDRFDALLADASELRNTQAEHTLIAMRLQWLIDQRNADEIYTYYEDQLAKADKPQTSEFLTSFKLLMVFYLQETHQYTDALNILSQLEDPKDELRAFTHANMYQAQALILPSQGEISRALSAGQKAAKSFRTLGFLGKLAGVQLNMALILLRKNDPDAAELNFQEALESFTEINDVRGQAIAWGNLSALQKNKGELALSIDYAQLAVELFRQVSDKGGENRTLFNMARTEIRLGLLTVARQHLQQARGYYHQAGKEVLEAHLLCSLSAIDRLEGKLDDSIAKAKLAWSLSSKNQAPLQMIIAQYHWGHSLRLKTDFKKAREAFMKLSDLAQKAGREDWETASMLGMATIYNDQKRYTLGLDEIQLALSRMTDKDDPTDLLLTYFQQARSQFHLQQTDLARISLSMARAQFQRGADLRWQLHLNLLQHHIDQQLSYEYKVWLADKISKKKDWELTQAFNKLFP